MQLLHCVFSLFYTPLFFCVHRISSASFYSGQLVYLLWNSFNDPIIGYFSDASTSSSVARRLPALRIGGPLCALTFAAIWMPIGCWWGDCNAAPSDGAVWLAFILQTFLYDGAFTYLSLAHSSLLADLVVSSHARATFTRAQAIGSASAAVAGVVIAAALWQPSDLRFFRGWTSFLGIASAICFVWAARVIERHAGAPLSELVAVVSQQESTEKSSTRDSLWQSTRSMIQFARQMFGLSSFRWFVCMQSAQQFMCALNNSLWLIFVDIFFGSFLLPWERALLVSGAFVLPHLNTILFTPLIARLGAYRVVRMLFRVRFAGALVFGGAVFGAASATLCTGCVAFATRVWLGRPGADPLQMAGADSRKVEMFDSRTLVRLSAFDLCAIGLFLVLHRVSTEAVCRLTNLLVADLVDEDRVRDGDGCQPGRAASLFGLQALLTKPMVSLAPMIGWFVLDLAGFKPEPEPPESSAPSWLSSLWLQFSNALAFDASAQVAVAVSQASPQLPLRSPLLLFAACALLFVLPLALLLCQIWAWGRYPLHGARLRSIKMSLLGTEESAEESIEEPDESQPLKQI